MRLQSEIKSCEAKLTIGIPFELHRIIKERVILSNSSMKDYVLDALKDKLQREAKLVKISSKQRKKTKAKAEQTMNKKLAHLLANADKIGKRTFEDVDSVMKYLLK